MALETGTYISDLVATNPTSTDAKSQGDDHLRLVKSTVKATFPNISGAVTPTHTELNYVAGLTAQPAAKDGSNLTTPATGDSSTKIATTAFVAATAFSSALPAQTGNAGKFVTTNGATASWGAIAPPLVIRSARTSNTILGAADSQSLVDITSGTFTQTFTAAATLGSGWFCYIRNSGTGDITLDPNASETIDGLTSYVMYPGEVRLVQCNGTALHSIIVAGFSRTFTATGTFTKPPGYLEFMVEAFGAGGGGGSGRKMSSGTDSSGGASGGGGSYINRQLLASEIASSETVTIGAGGAGGAGSGNDPHDGVAGSPGGSTTFGSLVTANPGQGGVGGQLSSTASGGLGGGVIASTNSASTQAEIGRGGAGGQVNQADANGYAGFGSFQSGAAGGGGGGRPNNRNGGAGGSRSNQGGGGSGGAHGTSTTPGASGGGGVTFGFGGGGGGAAFNASAGNGGAGGVSGGGGGGGNTYGFNLPSAVSGNGGTGGRGEVRILGVI